jgi:signal peptide peptidase SppA
VKTYSHIRRALAGKLWFMHEQKMNEILAFLELKLAGGSSSAETIAAIRAANEISAARAQKVSASSSGSVAVIPIYGLIMHRPSMDVSGPGGTSCEDLTQQLRQAVGDPNVSAIVFDVDSPGGDVDGVDELATEIFNARKQKKITAVSNCLCASAAYYLASQASEIVVSPSSLTGSIGVYTMHEDDSAALENAGVKLTLIKFGENKAEGNNLEPLTDSAREHLQETVDTFGAMFEKAVARGRKVSQADVHGKFGQGRIFDAKTAVRLGIADRVGTLDDVLQGYGVARNASASARALDAPILLASAKKSSPDDDDDEDSDEVDEKTVCSCTCKECKAGDCKACSNQACDSKGCACGNQSRARKAQLAIERRRLELSAA